jgi:hypothetical protein
MMGTKGHIALSALIIISVVAVALVAAFGFRGDDIEDTPAAVTSASQEDSAETSKGVAIERSDIGIRGQGLDHPVVAPQASALVEPDPDFVREMQRADVRPIGWTTAFSLHSVDYKEIRIGSRSTTDYWRLVL